MPFPFGSGRAVFARWALLVFGFTLHPNVLPGQRGEQQRPHGTVHTDTTRATEIKLYQIHLTRMAALSASLMAPYWASEEFHDTQAFPVTRSGVAAFGPIARVVASPFVAYFKHASDVDLKHGDPILVAMIDVDAQPSPAPDDKPYHDLNLVGGLNCIYLAHADPNAEEVWKAWIIPIASNQCVRPAASDATNLEVQYERQAFSPDDYPGAARFANAQGGEQLVGVLCGDAICWIGPPGSVLTPSLNEQSGFLRSRRASKVRLWHDEQVISALEGGVLVQKWRASVTPDEGLERLSHEKFTGGYKTVGWIFLDGNPDGTKYGTPPVGSPTPTKYWGMKQGLNRIEFFYNATGNWVARLVQVDDQTGKPAAQPIVTPLQVKPMPHPDVWIPGTARFAWSASDESVWISCDQGCCRVDVMAADMSQ